MLRQFSSFVLTHWRIILLLTISASVVMGFGASRMSFTSDYRVYFSDNNPQLRAFEELQQTYSKNDSVLFVLTPKNQDLFSPDTLFVVQQLTKAAWTLPYSTRVDSIVNFQHTMADGDDLIVQSLVDNPFKMSKNELLRAREIALNEPLLRNQLISPSGDVTGINVMIELPGVNQSKEVPEIVQAARDMQSRFIAEFPQVEIRLTGQVINNNGFMEISKQDLLSVMPLAFFVSIFCIAVFMYVMSGHLYTSLTGTIAIVIIIFASIATGIGLAGWMGINFSTVTASAPTVILTLAVADCIHILMTFLQRVQSGFPKPKAMEESLRINFRPVLLTSLTTIIGFLSMNFSDSPPFRDLGNIVAMGVFAAWFFAITLLPALMMLLPVKAKRHSWDRQMMENFADRVIRYRTPLFVVLFIWIVSSLSFIGNNELNDQWSTYFDPSLPHRQASDYTAERLTGLGRINFSVNSGKENGVTNPDYLNKLDSFAHWLREQPEVIHVQSFSDIIKRLNKNMHEDKAEWYRTPENPLLASQYLLLYEMSLPFGLDLNNQVNVDKSATRLTASLINMSTNQIMSFQERAKSWQQHNLPSIMFHEGSSPDVMFAHIGFRNIRSMLTGTFIAIVLISVILTIALRSIKYGLVSFALNIIPAGIAFGIWGFWVGKVGLGLSVVTGVTLGIVVDYTVHFLTKYIAARRERNLDAEQGIHYAFRSVGIALVVTTIILCANFSIMSLSNFKMNADFGILTAGTIVTALIVDFLFLPPLLMFISRVVRHH